MYFASQNCEKYGPRSDNFLYHMGVNATKPVFGVSDKARLKPVSSTTETDQKIEISLVASKVYI